MGAHQYGTTPYGAHHYAQKQRRTAVWVLVLTALVGWFFVSVGYSEVLVFRDLLVEKNRNYEEAYNYIHSPKSMCQDENADYRVRVGPMFDQCWSAKRVVEGSAWTEACIDLLKRWRICADGSCTIFSLDVFNALPFLFNAVLFTCMAIGAFVIFKIVSMIYSNFQQNNELPLCATPTQLAAMAFAHQHGNSGCAADPGAHKKQF